MPERIARVTLSVLAFCAVSIGEATAQGFDHAALDSVLMAFVRDSRVDYSALKADRDVLDRYLSRVGAVDGDEFRRWSEPERIAFLINAYNAYTLQMIIDHYPIEGSGFFEKLLKPKRFAFPANSIRHIDGSFDGITHRVAGQELTLDDIEHGLLRSNYNEPRIHFALVCAAVSCPPLRREAYRGARLNEQLDDQGVRFLNDPELNRFEPSEGEVQLSKIFDWFGEDFAQFADGAVAYEGSPSVEGVLSFITRYLPARIVEFLQSGEYDVGFLDYDWTLNDVTVTATR